MAVISSKNMYDILRKSFSILNPQLMHHSERTAYILYKMLLAEGSNEQSGDGGLCPDCAFA